MKRSLTLDQQRAEFAWRSAERAAQQGLIENYAILTKSTANLMMTSGLMQTLAFLQAKTKKNGRDQYGLLLCDLCRWLGRILGDNELIDGSRFPTEEQATFQKVMNALYHSPSDIYMRANSELMAFFRWLRQLADARKSQELTNPVAETKA